MSFKIFAVAMVLLNKAKSSLIGFGKDSVPGSANALGYPYFVILGLRTL